jgi:hypothetical protein
MKCKNMKTILFPLLAAVAITLSVNAANKGAEQLKQMTGAALVTTSTPVAAAPMACPKCKDVLTAVPDASGKGAQVLVTHGAPTQTVGAHLCAGCSTTITTSKTGKVPVRVVTHTCPAHCQTATSAN